MANGSDRQTAASRVATFVKGNGVTALAVLVDAYLAHATIVLALDSYVVSALLALLIAVIIWRGSDLSGRIWARARYANESRKGKGLLAQLGGQRTLSIALSLLVMGICLFVSWLRLVFGVSGGSGGAAANGLAQAAAGSKSGEGVGNTAIALLQLVVMATTWLLTYYSGMLAERRTFEAEIEELTREHGDIAAYLFAMDANRDLFAVNEVVEICEGEYETKVEAIRAAFDVLRYRAAIQFASLMDPESDGMQSDLIDLQQIQLMAAGDAIRGLGHLQGEVS